MNVIDNDYEIEGLHARIKANVPSTYKELLEVIKTFTEEWLDRPLDEEELEDTGYGILLVWLHTQGIDVDFDIADLLFGDFDMAPILSAVMPYLPVPQWDGEWSTLMRHITDQFEWRIGLRDFIFEYAKMCPDREHGEWLLQNAGLEGVAQ